MDPLNTQNDPLTQLSQARIEKATRLQHQASDPIASVWVSANAGSGKTHVLVQRIIRLMLHGVPPDKILALTYTKATACPVAITKPWNKPANYSPMRLKRRAD